MALQIVYAKQPFPKSFRRMLNLLGPSPRGFGVPSWRVELALPILEELGFNRDGDVVIVPELPGGVPPQGLPAGQDYDQQTAWEDEGLSLTDVAACWLPLDAERLPGLVSRTEFGMLARSGRRVVGAPDDAFKTRFIRNKAAALRISWFSTLRETLAEAVARLSTRVPAELDELRCGAERKIPRDLWLAADLREWLARQRAAGHELHDVTSVEWTFRVGPAEAAAGGRGKGFPLYKALHVQMSVSGENRLKSNEVVVIRPSIGTVCAYSRGAEPDGDRFLLVKEYRTPCLNAAGFVFELPGGASLKGGDPQEIGRREFLQETGRDLPKERFRRVGTYQLAATMVANQALLLAVELTAAEMDEFAALEAQSARFGNPGETEITYPVVRTRREIRDGDFVDAVNMGLIYRACP